jgi:hypothetical protein
MPASLRQRRRGYAVMRSRYTEDCLGESLRSGIRQYLIVGGVRMRRDPVTNQLQFSDTPILIYNAADVSIPAAVSVLSW